MMLSSTTLVRTVGLLSGVALAALIAGSCSASDGTDTDGSGGSSSSAGTGAQAGTGGTFDWDSGTNDTGLDDGSACAADTFPGVLVPLDLYIMLDKSSSMTDGSKWSSVISALSTFVTSSESDGMGVGIQFFPLPPPPGAIYTGPCSSDAQCGPLYGPCLPGFNVCAGAMALDTSCDWVDYSQPAVAIAELPGAAGAMTSALNAANADGDATPTQPAMLGALDYASAWAAAHPSHLTYVVFATDGEPTGCMNNNSIDNTAQWVAGAAAADPPVKTFVIGVGSELSVLNQLAAAGGTGQAYLVDTGSGVTQQFIDALNEIRADGACKFQIPLPRQGTPDYDAVNVSLFDPDNPDDAVTIYYVGSEAGCNATAGGWYYDDPAAPQMILLCEATCNQVKLTDWSVNVLLGCETLLR